ncbi:hypothetical protein G7Y89_g7807 [Cudoniella acicularis]|uniref:G-protein coupled receptors family 2 profile 2 domain-containing protein n=1 Tax=Cudoniella acicularis TaxID=354080 RepID=A0A8H4RJT1_9HELO|nr:hypothetical protein G7Y89_g7807 [Cudoniella acicularis]
MTLSEDQLHTLGIVGRCASILSILGIATIISAFCFSRQFRNPIHRLIFINALYNLFDVTATTISLSGPEAGNSSALCQFQGFLMQMFPLTDVLWTLAMACDVYLMVFYRYEAEDLHRLEIKYIGVITSFTLIPAATFLFIHNAERGPMYGSVTWVMFRIIFFYGPIWLIIAIAMILYCLVGIEILKQRRVFKSLGNEYVTLDTIVSANNASIKHSTDNNTEAKIVEANVQTEAVHIANLHAIEKEISVPSSLKSSSHPQPPPCDSIASSSDRIRRHSMANSSPVSFRQFVLMPLMFFVVLLAIWVAPTTNRISAFVNPQIVSYPLLLAVGLTGSLRGVLEWTGICCYWGESEEEAEKVKGT